MSNEKAWSFGPATGKPSHQRAAKLLACALTLDTEAAWNSASAVWALRLTKGERAAIALAALDALDSESAAKIMEIAMGGQGMPLPAFLDPADNAAWWADLATLPELRAYCRAAFLAMPYRERRAFLDFARGARK